MSEEKSNKSVFAQKEEEILKFWQDEDIFKKTLKKDSPKGDFVFFEGPPTANAKPALHHLEARAFKDAIPRYKTMQGYKVVRKGGWDTHGLPVELQVEKALGLKSKKEIEEYGVEKFNKICKESVWEHIGEWKNFTNRIGFWVDLYNPYVTYDPSYVEALWAIVKKVDERKLLYKDYKVLPWCPRCGTALSSHELAQGYKDVKDLSVTAKFKVKEGQLLKSIGSLIPDNTYLLAWTTTPWTLPGNVGLAVGSDIHYTLWNEDGMNYIVAEKLAPSLFKNFDESKTQDVFSVDLVGLEYEPLYPFLADAINKTGGENVKALNEKAYRVYEADFVTTEDGTGIVHTAVMYGQDDFVLGTKVGLPKHHLVNEDGTFKEGTGFLEGKFVKEEGLDVEIIKDLAHRGLLFSKEKYEHSYPHCWRCKTPLVYYARDSWYIGMSKLRDELVSENQKINWEPEYIKNGRFGEWLKDIKDWAISRERYWGTPLPVWNCESCEKRIVVGSYDEIKEKTSKAVTKLVLIRHGESIKNVNRIYSSALNLHPLTEKGKRVAGETAEFLKTEGDVKAIYSSPVLRARDTAEIISKKIGINIVTDDRLHEIEVGNWEEKSMDDPVIIKERKSIRTLSPEGFYTAKRGGSGESWKDIEDRVVDFYKEILEKHKGETVAIVSHEGVLAFLVKYLKDMPSVDVKDIFDKGFTNPYAIPKHVYVDAVTGKEFNPHRPYVDNISLKCDCGGKMNRVKEVMDVWFDSGAMPFAQRSGERGNEKLVDNLKNTSYPADFIVEAIDQTRGWFYTLHAIGVLMEKGLAYKNVISLGHILDSEGKKMSKSVGNIVEPWAQMEKYGADALRFWMYSVNQPGEPKNYDEKTVDEIVKKVFNLTSNVLTFYKLYESKIDSGFRIQDSGSIKNPLDKWIVAKLNELVKSVTGNLDNYKLLEPTRAIRDFVGDLSQWYLKLSRDRLKDGDKEAVATLRFVLVELSKVMAPFTPFFAEYLYKEVGGEKESVHLEDWPEHGTRNMEHETEILKDMESVRNAVSSALEKRARAKINVRQPLKSMSSKTSFRTELSQIIKDAVNVKEIIHDESITEDVILDTEITPELKEEGSVREFIRAVQNLRKEKGLNPSDSVVLVVQTEKEIQSLVEKKGDEIKKVAGISEIKFEENNGQKMTLDDKEVTFDIIK